MTIAEKLLRAKTDIDEVYEAGYNKGHNDGFGECLIDKYPVLMQQAKRSYPIDVQGETLYPASVYNDTKGLIDGRTFDDICEFAVTESSSLFELEFYNNTGCEMDIMIRISWTEYPNSYEHLSYAESIRPYETVTIRVNSKQEGYAATDSWKYEILGVRYYFV